MNSLSDVVRRSSERDLVIIEFELGKVARAACGFGCFSELTCHGRIAMRS
jgi:hypothetical protein